MPPLDIMRQTPVVVAVRRVLFSLRKKTFIRMLGANIMILSKKMKEGKR
jgi:hypothetical protein